MKKLIALMGIIWAAMVIIPVVAQVPVPFWQWPALYDASENLVAKRGIDRDGTANGKVYIRIGWGGCLAVFEDEWDDMVQSLHTDRYINMRAYAEERLAEDTEQIGWGPDDSYNCPQPPMEVKPYWRGSRPTYEFVHNEELDLWQKGAKTAYRILSPGPAVAACTQYNARKDDGTGTNFLMIADGAEVYIGDETWQSGFDTLGVRLLTVCEAADVSVEGYRF